MPTAVLTQLRVYPIKGCRGVEVPAATVINTGLALDRIWMIVRDGKFLCQRRCPQLALVVIDLPAGVCETAEPPLGAMMTLSAPGMASSLSVPLHNPSAHLRTVKVQEWTGQAADEGDEAAAWLTKALGDIPCRLVRYVGADHEKFQGQTVVRPVDPDYASGFETALADAFPFLLANQASLDDLNARLAASDSTGANLAPLPITRFRPNFFVSGLAAWEEDQWRTVRFLPEGELPIQLTSVKPADRCKVTTVDPLDATFSDGEPLDILSTFRKGSDLGYKAKSFKHAVFFAWNLVAAPECRGRVVKVGDTVDFSEAQHHF
eukprot:CAMPEP_0119102294 /NCGR_PEP_ID=MMETSP1180-20130426/1081_1 /TAXON_ID=3052 ORGANISM="Chlamydomonas cf sp, Strain CCMP681" /NCGR_SAMPLE_ID=MMETSP1180 /ASSEMBLY_ACC=CAM_ASM_000741 /LENGTH=319 /DNA_ID=CAMNT_0007086549 /DNA_START=15 /DNA_END=974 /DNA_ORIENTATION=-